MFTLVAGALAAAVLGGPHCAAMCGGLACATGPGRAWHLGRLCTYGALGALAGTAASLLPAGAPAAGVLAALLLGIFAFQLSGVALPVPGVVRAASALVRRPGLPARVAFGALTGLLPCGLLWSAVGLAAAAQSSLAGALVMAAFWAGTLPSLAAGAWLARRLAASRPGARRLVAAFVLVLGLGAIWARSAPGECCHVPAAHSAER